MAKEMSNKYFSIKIHIGSKQMNCFSSMTVLKELF